MGPDPNKAIPNPDIPGLVYIKKTIKNPNIIVGDYTYYFDATGTDNFEEHVTNFYPFSKDKLIIGANAVVASNIPSYAIAVGNPARVVKKRFDDEMIDLLEEFKWWDKEIDEINDLIPLLSNSDLEHVKQIIRERLEG